MLLYRKKILIVGDLVGFTYTSTYLKYERFKKITTTLNNEVATVYSFLFSW